MPPSNNLEPVLTAIDELKAQIHNSSMAPQDRRERAEDFLDAVKELLKSYCRRNGSYYEWNYVSGNQGQ